MWLDVGSCRRPAGGWNHNRSGLPVDVGLEIRGKECGVMQTLSVADFALRLAVGVGCGALIGLERQWRARMAGLRTNALVAAGATFFLLYAGGTQDSRPPPSRAYLGVR